MKFYLFLILSLVSVSAFAQDGLVKSYYPDGHLESSIFYIKDVLDGTSKWYYNNGVVKEERSYSMGVLNGWIRKFYENGARKEETPVNNGIKDGIAKEFYNNGGLKILYKYEQGVLKERKEFNFDSTLKPPILVFKKKKSETEEKPVDKVEEKLSKEIDSAFFASANKNAEATANKNTEVRESKIEIPALPQKNQKIDIDGAAYYMNVDVPPEPIGGNGLLQRKAVYPKAAGKADVKGEVIVLAKIDENGKVLEAKVEKGLGYGCDESAVKAVMSTLFRPGKAGKDYVNVLLRIPLKFQEPD